MKEFGNSIELVSSGRRNAGARIPLMLKRRFPLRQTHGQTPRLGMLGALLHS